MDDVYQFFKSRGFLPADRDSHALFREYEGYSVLQEMSAVIIAAWSFAYNGLYKKIDRCLCSVYFYPGKPVYFAVHRPPDYPPQAVIDTLYGLCREAGLPFLRIKFIEERFLGEFQAARGYRVQTDWCEDDDEYAYPLADLLETSGSANFYKRKRLKKAFADPRLNLRPMTRANIHLCAGIETEWCGHLDCAGCMSYSGCEKKAMEIMADIFDERIHRGLFLYAGDKPEGYIICEQRSRDLAFLYFGKANIQDYFVYLIYMMFKENFPGIQYMNMNEDMGHSGLRMFKRHLSVHERWRKYVCTYTKGGGEV